MATLGGSGGGGSYSSPIMGGGGGGTIINGGLTFGGGGGSMFTGGMDGLAQSYNSAYNAALAANQQNYNNILAGYQQLAVNQQNNQQQIMQGYTQLNNDVLNRLSGSNSSNIQQINDYYRQQLGSAGQQLTDAGLNNTTVVSSVNRGINLDQAKAVTDSNNRFAQLIAQYQSQLGLAGLGYMGQASQEQTALGVKQLDWMNSIEIPYPDASAYAQLAMYYGQMDQADKNRDLYEKYLGTMGSPGQVGGGFSGVYGAQPMPTYGSSGSGSYTPMGTSPGPLQASAVSYGNPSNYNYGLGAVAGGWAGYDQANPSNALEGVVGGWAGSY